MEDLQKECLAKKTPMWQMPTWPTEARSTDGLRHHCRQGCREQLICKVWKPHPRWPTNYKGVRNGPTGSEDLVVISLTTRAAGPDVTQKEIFLSKGLNWISSSPRPHFRSWAAPGMRKKLNSGHGPFQEIWRGLFQNLCDRKMFAMGPAPACPIPIPSWLGKTKRSHKIFGG